jgi:hypothetical protein
MGRIVNTILIVAKCFQTKLNAEFLNPFRSVLECLVPLLTQNINHKGITGRIIFFVQSNIVTIGAEILPLLSDIVILCCKNMDYIELEDTMTLLNVAVTNFKSESLSLVRACISELFLKA